MTATSGSGRIVRFQWIVCPGLSRLSGHHRSATSSAHEPHGAQRLHRGANRGDHHAKDHFWRARFDGAWCGVDRGVGGGSSCCTAASAYAHREPQCDTASRKPAVSQRAQRTRTTAAAELAVFGLVGAGRPLMPARTTEFTKAFFVPRASEKDNVIGGPSHGPQICPQHRL